MRFLRGMLARKEIRAVAIVTEEANRLERRHFD
jgi:hypothetical protein